MKQVNKNLKIKIEAKKMGTKPNLRPKERPGQWGQAMPGQV